MYQIAFIAKRNHTNQFIYESLNSNFSVNISFINPATIFSKEEAVLDGTNNLVIVDLNTSFGFGHAPRNIREIKKSIQETPLLILDHHKTNNFIQPLIDAGASGIISHTPSEEKLKKALSTLLDGDTFYDCPPSLS